MARRRRGSAAPVRCMHDICTSLPSLHLLTCMTCMHTDTSMCSLGCCKCLYLSKGDHVVARLRRGCVGLASAGLVWQSLHRAAGTGLGGARCVHIQTSARVVVKKQFTDWRSWADSRGVSMQTTPPCAETLLWHVFNEALTITAEAKTALEQIIAQTSTSSNPNIKNDYRHNNRPLQPLRDRTIFFAHTK